MPPAVTWLARISVSHGNVGTGWISFSEMVDRLRADARQGKRRTNCAPCAENSHGMLFEKNKPSRILCQFHPLQIPISLWLRAPQGSGCCVEVPRRGECAFRGQDPGIGRSAPPGNGFCSPGYVKQLRKASYGGFPACFLHIRAGVLAPLGDRYLRMRRMGFCRVEKSSVTE